MSLLESSTCWMDHLHAPAGGSEVPAMHCAALQIATVLRSTPRQVQIVRKSKTTVEVSLFKGLGKPITLLLK